MLLGIVLLAVVVILGLLSSYVILFGTRIRVLPLLVSIFVLLLFLACGYVYMVKLI